MKHEYVIYKMSCINMEEKHVCQDFSDNSLDGQPYIKGGQFSQTVNLQLENISLASYNLTIG
jgi:hypothetical protein